MLDEKAGFSFPCTIFGRKKHGSSLVYSMEGSCSCSQILRWRLSWLIPPQSLLRNIHFVCTKMRISDTVRSFMKSVPRIRFLHTRRITKFELQRAAGQYVKLHFGFLTLSATFPTSNNSDFISIAQENERLRYFACRCDVQKSLRSATNFSENNVRSWKFPPIIIFRHDITTHSPTTS
jgi:hypothetical protein